MRKCKDVHYSIVVLHLSLWSFLSAALLLAIFAFYGDDEIVAPEGWHEWILTGFVSIFKIFQNFLSQFGLTRLSDYF